jgi:hypothetical protein
MLKRVWKHLVAIPDGLDFGDRIYTYGNYLICAILALAGLLLFGAAFTGHMSLFQRMVVIGASLSLIGLSYALRHLIYWTMKGKIWLLQRFRLA